MEREKMSPLASSITLGEQIHRFVNEVQMLLAVSIVGFVWILVFSALWLAGFPSVLYSLYIPFGFVGGIIAILAVPFIYAAWKTVKSLEKWNEEFIRFSYVLKFEVMPSTKTNPTERIMEQLLNIFVELGGVFGQTSYESYINANVEGKKDSHIFGIYVGIENTKHQKKLHEFHKSNGDLFAKRFVKTEPVNAQDLQFFFNEVSDVVKATKAKGIFRMVVASGTAFDESAMAFVKNKKNWIKRKSADLIEETSEGFRVIWVS